MTVPRSLPPSPMTVNRRRRKRRKENGEQRLLSFFPFLAPNPFSFFSTQASCCCCCCCQRSGGGVSFLPLDSAAVTRFKQRKKNPSFVSAPAFQHISAVFVFGAVWGEREREIFFSLLQRSSPPSSQTTRRCLGNHTSPQKFFIFLPSGTIRRGRDRCLVDHKSQVEVAPTASPLCVS